MRLTTFGNIARATTRRYVCVLGGKKCSFFRKSAVLCFLVTSVFRFALLPYYRRLFYIQLNFRPLTIITKRSILDVATDLDPPLKLLLELNFSFKTIRFTEPPCKQENKSNNSLHSLPTYTCIHQVWNGKGGLVCLYAHKSLVFN